MHSADEQPEPSGIKWALPPNPRWCQGEQGHGSPLRVDAGQGRGGERGGDAPPGLPTLPQHQPQRPWDLGSEGANPQQGGSTSGTNSAATAGRPRLVRRNTWGDPPAGHMPALPEQGTYIDRPGWQARQPQQQPQQQQPPQQKRVAYGGMSSPSPGPEVDHLPAEPSVAAAFPQCSEGYASSPHYQEAYPMQQPQSGYYAPQMPSQQYQQHLQQRQSTSYYLVQQPVHGFFPPDAYQQQQLVHMQQYQGVLPALGQPYPSQPSTVRVPGSPGYAMDGRTLPAYHQQQLVAQQQAAQFQAAPVTLPPLTWGYDG